jgi:hypothetical protein
MPKSRVRIKKTLQHKTGGDASLCKMRYLFVFYYFLFVQRNRELFFGFWMGFIQITTINNSTPGHS